MGIEAALTNSCCGHSRTRTAKRNRSASKCLVRTHSSHGRTNDTGQRDCLTPSSRKHRMYYSPALLFNHVLISLHLVVRTTSIIRSQIPFFSSAGLDTLSGQPMMLLFIILHITRCFWPRTHSWLPKRTRCHSPLPLSKAECEIAELSPCPCDHGPGLGRQASKTNQGNPWLFCFLGFTQSSAPLEAVLACSAG